MTAEIDLSQFDDDFDETEAAERPGDLPDGNYQVRVERAELTKAKSSGNPMIKFMLRILSGSHKNRTLFKNSVITNNTLKWVKGDLMTCGLKLGRFSELKDRLSELLDVGLEVTQRTKGDNNNLYFNKRITIPSGGAKADQLSDDEVPF